MSEDKMKDRTPRTKADDQDGEADERETMGRAPTEGEHADGDDKAAPPAANEHSETEPDFDFEELDEDDDEGPELG